MTQDYANLARINRLIALATLATKKEMNTQMANVHHLPAAANRTSRPKPLFVSSRGKRASDILAA